MNATLETTTTRTLRRSATRPASAIGRQLGPATVDPASLIGHRPASEITRLIFCTLLGIAACVAMIGIVSQASGTATGPDDAPPAVIVEFD